ncbi:MAG: hypothetical protein Q7S31_01950 [bacterium]|nr:hypothetical protein [bacterium]
MSTETSAGEGKRKKRKVTFFTATTGERVRQLDQRSDQSGPSDNFEGGDIDEDTGLFIPIGGKAIVNSPAPTKEGRRDRERKSGRQPAEDFVD